MPKEENQEQKNFRILATLFKAEVKKRGGRIEVSGAEIYQLIYRGWHSENENSETGMTSLVFTLKEPDDERRDLTAFPHHSVFRLDVLFKHLIATTPGGRLVFTNKDLADDDTALIMDQHLDGFFALVATNQVIESLGKDGTTILIGETIKVTVTATPDPPPPALRN